VADQLDAYRGAYGGQVIGGYDRSVHPVNNNEAPTPKIDSETLDLLLDLALDGSKLAQRAVLCDPIKRRNNQATTPYKVGGNLISCDGLLQNIAQLL